VTLAELLLSRGRGGEALPALEKIYGSFDEGFETHDLQNARELIATLHQRYGGGSPREQSHPSARPGRRALGA
jgi:hypothetical protein